MRFLFPVLLAALMAAPVAANEIYRTVDERGVVSYSDRPLSDRSTLVRVEARTPAMEQAAAAAATRAHGDADDADAQRRQREADEATLAAAREEQSEIRAAACRQARAAQEAYETAPRLYESLPDGGRRYLSEEEIVRARQEARQAAADFCDD